MAWLEEHPTSGRFKICFRWGGRKLKKTVKTTSRKDAESALVRFEENIALLERGRIELPPGADFGTFLLSDGKVSQKPRPEATAKPITLGGMQERYVETHSHGAMEANSLDTVKMHLRHFTTTLGAGFTAQKLTLADLQRHVSERAKKKYRGKQLSPVTLKKEVASFRAAWNWAALTGLVKGSFPSKGLVYPKADEKLPFMTRQEIERKLHDGLTDKERAELWDCLYLTRPELDEFLEFVQSHAVHAWIHPFLSFVGHTGCRRSEAIRVLVSDVDFQGKTVLVREKKRSRKQRTTRRVPLTPFLAGVLQDWLEDHLGGQYLFCQQGEVFRSKKRSKTTGHRNEQVRSSTLKGRLATVKNRALSAPGMLTRDESHDHFKRTVAGSKWEVLHGYHLLRHSFISICASCGVDQRLIDEWVGHQTEEQRKRYRHLLSSAQQEAINSAFA